MNQKPSRSDPHLKSVFLALFVTFLWSTSWILIKIGLKASLPPVTFAGLRYTLAFLCLFPFILLNPKHRKLINHFSRSTWLQLVLLGLVFYTITQGAQFIGLAFLPAATVTLLLNFSPIFVAIPSGIINKEKTNLVQWVGIVLSIIGAIIYFLPLSIPLNQVIGLVAVLIGVLANASSSLLGRKVNTQTGLPAILITTISMGIGGSLLLLLGSITQGFGQLAIQQWLIIAWLAIVNTALAFTLWNKSLQVLTAVESSIINGTMLPQIAILAWIFLDEPLGLRQIFGLGLVTIGIIVVQVKKKNRETGENYVISCQAILFDLDGVLIDSTSCIERHWQEWSEKHQIDLAFILQNAHGVRTIETMKIVAPYLNCEKEAAEFTANEIRDTAGVIAIPGAKALIEQIPANRWAIVTSGSFDLVQARLQKAGLPMPKVIVTAEDVSHGKPSPEPYLKGAQKLGVSIDQCCVIEDAPIGVKSGINAGAKVIGVLSTHSEEELTAAGANYLIGNITQIQMDIDHHSNLISIQTPQ